MKHFNTIEGYNAMPLREAVKRAKELEMQDRGKAVWLNVINKMGSIFEISYWDSKFGNSGYDELTGHIQAYGENGLPVKSKYNNSTLGQFEINTDTIDASCSCSMGRMPLTKELTQEELIDFLDNTDFTKWILGKHVNVIRKRIDTNDFKVELGEPLEKEEIVAGMDLASAGGDKTVTAIVDVSVEGKATIVHAKEDGEILDLVNEVSILNEAVIISNKINNNYSKDDEEVFYSISFKLSKIKELLTK